MPKKNADQLSEKPQYQQNKEGIRITFPSNASIDQNLVSFELYRTDDANLDVKKEISVDAQNALLIPAKVLTNGSYTLKLKWKSNKKPYQLDYDILWK